MIFLKINVKSSFGTQHIWYHCNFTWNRFVRLSFYFACSWTERVFLLLLKFYNNYFIYYNLVVFMTHLCLFTTSCFSRWRYFSKCIANILESTREFCWITYLWNALKCGMMTNQKTNFKYGYNVVFTWIKLHRQQNMIAPEMMCSTCTVLFFIDLEFPDQTFFLSLVCDLFCMCLIRKSVIDAIFNVIMLLLTLVVTKPYVIILVTLNFQNFFILNMIPRRLAKEVQINRSHIRDKI